MGSSAKTKRTTWGGSSRTRPQWEQHLKLRAKDERSEMLEQIRFLTPEEIAREYPEERIHELLTKAKRNKGSWWQRLFPGETDPI